MYAVEVISDGKPIYPFPFLLYHIMDSLGLMSF
jgi:hypothetical protein